jgi:hypothetical protein
MVRRTPRGTKPPTAREAAHAAGVRAERLESGFQGVLEAVTSMRQELGAEIRAVRTELSGKIEDLQDAVRTNSADIRQNSADIKAMRVDLTSFRHDFDHREERGRVTALEERVSAIETQLSNSPR